MTSLDEEPTIEPRVHLYQRVADELRQLLLGAEYQPGTVLPSESRLAEIYDTSRLTIKRALNVLRHEGLIDARRGFGWFVPGGAVRHELGELSTIDEGVTAMGLRSERRVLEFAFTQPTPVARAVLECDFVLKTSRLNLADGRPAAHVTTWCPAELGADMSRAAVESTSLYDLLPVGIGWATQVIRAVGADAEDAALLDISAGAACLRSERTTFSTEGRPVIYAVAVFPGMSTEYLVELKWQGRPSQPGHFVQLPANAR